tara:strand:- start:667 stop:948 length:282 start_codon:yes stop_codon:yes gene_type:complete
MKLKTIFTFLFFFSCFLPSLVTALGKTYSPEEGTFDRRKRIVIHPKCRLVKETIVPDDVICEYQSQRRGDKNKQIFLGAPGNTCQKEITCPVK